MKSIIKEMISMAVTGGAVFTTIMGMLADITGSTALFIIVPMACYIFLTYYSFIGSKVRIPVKI
jgi:FHS family L-fucose permease-like MFS transporter